MSPLSPRVLGAATLVSSPALWLGLVDRTLPLDVALSRYLVALVLCWAALSVVATWAFPDPGASKAQRPPAEDSAEEPSQAVTADSP
jgi:hypothetical protein